MAYARECDGFVYISASHNPVGHNGIKFGFNDGGVIPGSEAAKLTALFLKFLMYYENFSQKAVELYNDSMQTDIASVYNKVSFYKEEALAFIETLHRPL